ncbi:hypothetical protein E2C01_002953 [Portunus trituberculatus]|uniref:Uncharacterized protein n=1 Tax=Portunus trituberculatus TaxID=210409 RepID=A0A5B7CL93_PORTR|nr:hypothetical protein [Portunus trituberculatus]
MNVDTRTITTTSHNTSPHHHHFIHHNIPLPAINKHSTQVIHPAPPHTPIPTLHLQNYKFTASKNDRPSTCALNPRQIKQSSPKNTVVLLVIIFKRGSDGWS